MKTGLNLLFRRPADSPWMRLALLAAALCFLNGGAMAQELQLLHREGDLFAGSGEQPVAEDKRTFSRDTLLRVGQTVPPALAQALLATPPASGVAVFIAPGQVVTLVQGAAMQVKQGEEGSLDLELSGTAHILLEAEAPPLKLSLAGRVLETSRAVLFYNGWAQPPRLTVVTGGVKLAGPKPENIEPDKMAGDEKPTGGTKPAAEEKPTKADAAGGAVLLKEGDMVALGELPSAPESTTEEERQLQRWAELAGFTAPGPYKRVGVALSSDEKLLVERYGEEAGLSGKAIVILEGDKLRTHKPQQVLIRFDNKDRIKLFGESTFHIEEHVTGKQVEENLLFRMFGKVRALLTARIRPATIRFNTPTASLGVKGTDFQSVASAADTEVSVLDGLLGVSDPAGQGTVDVPAGMFTTVPKGQLPAPPAPIPPDKLRQLRTEAIPAERISMQSPSEGEILRRVELAYEVLPPGAPVEVLLDGKVIEAASGTVLTELPDGEHSVTVKAAATDTPAQSAAFIIDTTPPALAEGVKLDALRVEADKPLLLSWKEPLQTLEVTVGDKPVAVELSGEGTQATLQPDPELLQAGQPVTLRIRAVDRAGNEFVGEGTLLPLAKPPEAPAPKAPAPKEEPAAPTPKAAAMPGGSLKQRYQGTLARDTGYVLDELYLNDRGPFFETPGFAAGGPQEPPRAGLYPSLAYPHSYLRAVEDPFFRRHSVTREEEGTPIPGSGESARGQDN